MTTTGGRPRVLLTGSTGFVGAATFPALLARGFDVRGGTRRPEEASRAHPERTYVRVDVGDRASLDAALEGVDAAIYLVHGMAADRRYAEIEPRQAENFRDAAAAHGVSRIVYLGGTRPAGRPSRHLKSRLRTGEILRSGSVPVVELRATMIIGSGSESFRIVRDLAARLPWMILPRWLDSITEPVAIADVSAAIVRSIEIPLGESRVYGVPGPEALSGRAILLRTARLLGQRPTVWSVPLVTPHLSSYWIRLVTRANGRVAAELVEGLRSDIVSTEESIWPQIPDHARVALDDAIATALRDEETTLPRTARFVERALHRLSRA
jgi:uncharacterized protein YbjT (DUF2867 family)